MEYKIIRYVRKTNETTEQAIKAFEELMNEKLAEGWQILGGIAVENGAFYQAIVKVN